MKCLLCWTEIRAKVAIYTKSCKHLFCKSCGNKVFKKELSCPLCDTVLAKDGIAEITLQPDENDLSKASANILGFDPQQMCQVLQLGLDFWAKQKNNETLKHIHDIKLLKKKLEEADAHNSKLIKALEDERLKKKAIQQEKESLKALISELETRYADKAKAMRKLSDLYNDLRQVHKRMEQDLRGVRDNGGYDNHELDDDTLPKSAIEVKTVKQSENQENLRGMVGEPSQSHEVQYEPRIVEARSRGRAGGYNAEESREKLAQHNLNDFWPTGRYDTPDDVELSVYNTEDFHNPRRRAPSLPRRHSRTPSPVPLPPAPHAQAPVDDMFAIPPNRSSLGDIPTEDRRTGRRSSHRRDCRRSGDMRIDYHDMEHRFSRPRHGKR